MPESTFDPGPITTKGVARQIADQLRERIVRGELAPGERLPPEPELARHYRVSRGTIRETMKLLSAAQLVEPTRGAAGGTFVRLPDAGDLAASVGETIALWFNAGDTTLAEVEAARAWVEEGCVRMAAVRRTDADLAAIRATVEAGEAATDIDALLAADIEFHQAVSRAAHNAVLELAMNAIHLVRPYTNTMMVPLLAWPTVAGGHREIFAAIEAGDVDAAVAALARHLEYLRGVRERALADRPMDEVSLAALSTGTPYPSARRPE